jgi:hypothetical protein
MKNIYYYLLFDQKLFFENETIEELLRERANYYYSKDKTIDFWLLPSPKFIEKDNYINFLSKTSYYKTKILNNKSLSKDLFTVALISTNIEFIKWIELRVGYFESYNDSNINENLNSNGLKGTLELTDSELFSYSSNKIYPDLLLNRYKENLSLIYSNIK